MGCFLFQVFPFQLRIFPSPWAWRSVFGDCSACARQLVAPSCFSSAARSAIFGSRSTASISRCNVEVVHYTISKGVVVVPFLLVAADVRLPWLLRR